MTRPLRERLFSRLIIDPQSGCLLWTGAKNDKGYGTITAGGRTQYVHRVMYEMFVGEIPAGLELDHVKARGCVSRHCASPAHLEPVTHRQNLLRTDGFGAANVAVTHCPAGHEYDLANTYYRPGGGRGCRKCQYESNRRRKADPAVREYNRLAERARYARLRAAKGETR